MLIQSNMFNDEPRLDLSQYYTPPALAEKMWDWVVDRSWPWPITLSSRPLRILEPSIREGALIKMIPSKHSVVGYDLDERNLQKIMLLDRPVDFRLRNFLNDSNPGYFDLALMNPPYENDQDLDFAKKVVIDGVASHAVMLMRSVFRHGVRRWEEFWRWVDLHRQVDLVNRPKFGGDGVAKSDFSIFDVTRRYTPLSFGEVQKVEIERWRI